MEKFACIGHPIDLKHIYQLSGSFVGYFLKKCPPYNVKQFLYNLGPLVYGKIQIESIIDRKALGYGIIVPLLPEQFVFLKEDQALKRIFAAVRKAERLKAKIVTLGGFTSVIGDEGRLISQKANIAITSGNTYTACLALQGIEKACDILETDLSLATVSVFGATGDIGSICTKILAKKARKIFLIARDKARLNSFAESLKKESRATVIVPDNSSEAVKNSDVILTATTSITKLIDPFEIKPGAIVCDVALPANIMKEVAAVRKDVLVFEGGLAKLPDRKNNFKNSRLEKAILHKNCIFGCFAEAMILSLEKKYENFSIGRGNITEDKINEIQHIACRHGFGVSDFFCGHKVYTGDDISYISSTKHNEKRI